MSKFYKNAVEEIYKRKEREYRSGIHSSVFVGNLCRSDCHSMKRLFSHILKFWPRCQPPISKIHVFLRQATPFPTAGLDSMSDLVFEDKCTQNINVIFTGDATKMTKQTHVLIF